MNLGSSLCFFFFFFLRWVFGVIDLSYKGFELGLDHSLVALNLSLNNTVIGVILMDFILRESTFGIFCLLLS